MPAADYPFRSTAIAVTQKDSAIKFSGLMLSVIARL